MKQLMKEEYQIWRMEVSRLIGPTNCPEQFILREIHMIARPCEILEHLRIS